LRRCRAEARQERQADKRRDYPISPNRMHLFGSASFGQLPRPRFTSC
jgi:hypothetical protein